MSMFEVNTMGLKAYFDAPDSVEALDRLAGEQGATLKAALRNFAYHCFLPELRDAFADKLSDIKGIPIPQLEKDGEKQFKKAKEGEDPEPIYMSAQQFYNQLLNDGTVTEEEAQELMNEVCGEIAFDPTPSAGVRKPSKQAYTAADKLLAAIAAGANSWENVITKFEEKNAPTTWASLVTGEGDGRDRDTLARAVRHNEQRKAREADEDFS